MKQTFIALVMLCATLLPVPLAAQGHGQETTSAHDAGRHGVFSLLTCAPGDEIYELFGHTALRYRDPEEGIDLVFNYGMFSFGTPHFIWRFVKGETDYQLGLTTFDRFWPEYHYRGSSVYEQRLNLTDAQRQSLLSLLMTNYEPQNRVYRYNFFYDNCTTRARDKIEEAVGKEVVYDTVMPPTTFRKVIHEFAGGHKWSELGMDICIGSKADEPIDLRTAMFAPFYYKASLDHAFVTDTTGTRIRLADAPHTIVTPARDNKHELPPSPMAIFVTLFAITMLISAAEFKFRKTIWVFDILLFGATGLCGIVIAFLVFFSTHPATSPNFMLVFMHPLHLFLLPLYMYKEAKRRKSYYHIANAAVILMFFALIFVIPQDFNDAILFLALSLLTRSICYTLRTNCKSLTTA